MYFSDHVLQYFKTISVDFQTQILNANSSNVDFLQPDVYHFIILDLQCNGSKHILKKVCTYLLKFFMLIIMISNIFFFVSLIIWDCLSPHFGGYFMVKTLKSH